MEYKEFKKECLKNWIIKIWYWHWSLYYGIKVRLLMGKKINIKLSKEAYNNLMKYIKKNG